MFILIFGVLTEEQQHAVEKLFEKNNTLFHRISFRILKSEDASKDAVQTAFEKIMKHIEKISQLSGPQMEAFCVVIVKNTSLDMIRQSKKTLLTEDIQELWSDTEQASPEEELIRTSERAMLSDLLAQLPEEDRKLIVLRYIHNMGYKEIGCLLNISEEAAKKRGQRILKKLRSLYEGEQ